MKYIIIESLSAYDYAKVKFKKNKIIWVTTSPKVCDYFFKNDINFINIEKLVNNKDLDAISKISLKISQLSIKNFDELFLEKIYYSSAFMVSDILLRNTYTLIYKNYLLNKVLRIAKFKEVICIGDPNEKKIKDNILLGYDTDENLFSIIINNSKSKIKLVKYKNKEIVINKNNYFFLKKIISFININFSQFIYKIHEKFQIVNFNKKKNLLIINQTDHITKSFIKLKRHFNIIFFKEKFLKLNQALITNYNLTKNLESKYKKKLNKTLDQSMFFFKNSIIDQEKIIDYKYSIFLALHKILKFKKSISKNFEKIESQFNEIISNIDKKNFFILSNFSLNFMYRLFILYCKYKNIKIILCEHGLNGMANGDKYFQKLDRMCMADYGIYYWKKRFHVDKNFFRNTTKHKKIISGFPNFYKQIGFIIFIKKILIKLLLRLPIKKKVIIVLSDLEKNNSAYPGSSFDYQIININKKIVEYLAQSNPDKIIILKLYAVQKFLNLYNYEDLVSKFHNVKIVRDISFYYLKDLADEVYLWNATATLLDCILSNSNKVYFIKLPEIKSFINDFIGKKIYHKTNFKSQWFLLRKYYKKISYNWVKVIN